MSEIKRKILIDEIKEKIEKILIDDLISEEEKLFMLNKALTFIEEDI